MVSNAGGGSAARAHGTCLRECCRPVRRCAHVDNLFNDEQGIAHLNEAIEHGKQDHAEEATKHAEEALGHLEQAAK